MVKYLLWLLNLIIFAILLITGCGTSKSKNSISNTTITNTEPNNTVATSSTLPLDKLVFSFSSDNVNAKFKLMVYDAIPTGNISAVNLTVNGIDLITDTDKKISVFQGTFSFDLLQYKIENPLEILNEFIPPGRYKQIRLILADQNEIVVDGVSKPLKTPSGQQSGVKLDGFFEIHAGQIYFMKLHFDPNESIVYNPGQDRYILKPVIKITENSLVSGNFITTGLIAGETVLLNLDADGTVKIISGLDPKFEIHGVYYFDFSNLILRIIPSEAVCTICANTYSLPGSFFQDYDLSLKLKAWNNQSITAAIYRNGNAEYILFQKTNNFILPSLPGNTDYRINVTYPAALFNGKYGTILLMMLNKDHVVTKSFFDIRQIVNDSSSYQFLIPNNLLSADYTQNIFIIKPLIFDTLDQIKLLVNQDLSLYGQQEVANTFYQTTIRMTANVLTSNIVYEKY